MVGNILYFNLSLFLFVFLLLFVSELSSACASYIHETNLIESALRKNILQHSKQTKVKVANGNSLVTHFVKKKVLEMHENEQDLVLNVSSGNVRNHSEIVRILVLACHDKDQHSIYLDLSRTEKLQNRMLLSRPIQRVQPQIIQLQKSKSVEYI